MQSYIFCCYNFFNDSLIAYKLLKLQSNWWRDSRRDWTKELMQTDLLKIHVTYATTVTSSWQNQCCQHCITHKIQRVGKRPHFQSMEHNNSTPHFYFYFQFWDLWKITTFGVLKLKRILIFLILIRNCLLLKKFWFEL